MLRTCTRLLAAIFPAAAIFLSGCSKDLGNPLAAGNPETRVSLALSLSKSGSGAPLQKAVNGGLVDSLRIDSVTVVVASIRFQNHIDSVRVDSLGDDHGTDNPENKLTLKGPFVIRLRDSLTADFADQSIPAGTYDGITLRIRRFPEAEHFEDSDEHDRHGHGHSNNGLSGSSVVIWGAAYKNNEWVPFMLAFDMELHIKIRGNFVVPAAVSSVAFALNFDLGSWFRDPNSGAFLDPSDSSNHVRELITKAVRNSFGHGRGGHDRDDDGHPDD
jgi:hypothetical protein